MAKPVGVVAGGGYAMKGSGGRHGRSGDDQIRVMVAFDQ